MTGNLQITKNTAVSISLVAVLLGFAFWLGRVYFIVQSLSEDRYSLPMASEDALREALFNPGHKVPDPRNPGSWIVVQEAEVGEGIP